MMRRRATGGTARLAAWRQRASWCAKVKWRTSAECCRIRAGSPSLPERGPCCRGRAENSTAEGDRERQGETERINNRAKISLFSHLCFTGSTLWRRAANLCCLKAFRQMRDLEHVLIRPTVIPAHNKQRGVYITSFPWGAERYYTRLHSVTCHINVHLRQLLTLKVITCYMLHGVSAYVSVYFIQQQKNNF